jgi:hypothetical protein
MDTEKPSPECEPSLPPTKESAASSPQRRRVLHPENLIYGIRSSRLGDMNDPKNPCSYVARKKTTRGVFRQHRSYFSPFTLKGKIRFTKFLADLRTAKVFLAKPKSPLLWMVFSRNQRRLLYARLEKLDSVGMGQIFQRLAQMKRIENMNRKARKELIMAKRVLGIKLREEAELKKNLIVVEEAVKDVPGACVLRTMDAAGVKFLMALYLASGYTKDELCVLLGVSRDMINNLVTEQDIMDAGRKTPEAIVKLANSIVFKDLATGEITKRTVEADQIVARRTKAAVSVASEVRAREKASPARTQQQESHIRERFGVDRSKGAIIEGQAEEKEEKK